MRKFAIILAIAATGCAHESTMQIIDDPHGEVEGFQDWPEMSVRDEALDL